MVTDMQALGRAQFLMQFANDPLCDPKEIRERIMKAASIENIDKIILAQPMPNPEIAAKGMELEQRGKELQDKGQLLLQDAQTKKAQEVLYYAQAINQLAAADKAVGDQHIAWLDQQLQVWERQHEAATQPVGEGQTVPGAPPMPPPTPPPPAVQQ